MAAKQLGLLRATLEHAHRRIPFYGRVWKEAGFDPESVRSLDDVERIPIIDAPMVRLAIERGEMVDRDLDVSQVPSYPSSGISDVPVQVPRPALEQRLWRAGSLRIWFEHGFRWRESTAALDATRGPSHPLQRFGISRTTWIHTSWPVAEQVAAFARAEADVVMATPTVFRRLCRGIESSGAGFKAPRIVFSEGEVLDIGTKEMLRSTLGVDPIELYGLTEACFVAWQCERREGMHLSSDLSLVEVRRDGRKAEPGELGAIVLTDLRGRAMPLIRYDTGDLAIAGSGECGCGRSLPLIQSMEGRARASLTLPDRSILTTRTILDHLSSALPPDHYRVRQQSPGSFQIQLASTAGDAGASLTQSLRGLVNGAEIEDGGELEIGPDLPRKSNPVSSEVDCKLA
jgi:phenylacetate-coenzyme A ligase PaaK-like adenylate-forming protein